ncbi:hypothetical protein D3C71_1538890 [compost metagenome]
MFVQGVLDFRRPDLVARGVDHALEPIGDEEIAVFIHASQVAGAKVALAVQHEEGLVIGGRVIPIALHDLRAARHQFTHLAGRQRLQGGGVDHPRIDAEGRHADALALVAVHGVAVQKRSGLGQAVGFVEDDAVAVGQHRRHRLRHGRAAAAQQGKARQVE